MLRVAVGMNAAETIPPDALWRAADASAYGFDTTATLEPLSAIPGQDRALEALEFGLAIEAPGFNIFLLGAEGTGRRTAALEALSRQAAQRPLPDDWCYVNNFEDAHRPRALRLPAGTARHLAQHMEALTVGLASELPRVFGSEQYRAQRGAVMERLDQARRALLEPVAEEADRRGLVLIGGPQAVMLGPKGADGQLMTDEELGRLPAEERERLDRARQEVQQLVEQALRRFAEAAAKGQEELRELNRATVESAAAHQLQMLRARYHELPQVMQFLSAVEGDLLEVIDQLTTVAEAEPPVLARTLASEDFRRRYGVNVVVSYPDGNGAPVVEEPNPTHANLLGRIEHRVHEGVLTTDFTMIRAGALLRANGGYLLLDALDVLMRPFAWMAFMRALKQRELRIEEPTADLGIISTVSLQPEPIPLDVKVVLLGSPLFYYLLYALDRDFPEIFKVKADVAPTIPRTPEAELQYARFVAARCERDKIAHFEAPAVARLVEYGSREAHDQTRLTTRLSELADVVREAGFYARQRGGDRVTRQDVSGAIQARRRRANRLEEELERSIRDGTLLVRTRGSAAGQANGLAVLSLGDYAFAKPTRVSAAVTLGSKGVVDIERESKLGGPVHSKAVLILSGYLNERYGGGRPLVVTATLGLEQVYEGVEGDSATVAELLALLSALSGLPLRQDLAITGSMNQHGEIQPVGAVTEKVEGFFHACRIQGFTGSQGVVVPDRNRQHLMLDREVVDAVAAGQFHLYAARHADEAIALVFDRPAEEVHRAVEARLDAFVESWQRLQPPGGGPQLAGGGPERKAAAD